jgi:hypothetical protein
VNFLPWLALNHNSPDLSVPTRYDYSNEPLSPGLNDTKPTVEIISTMAGKSRKSIPSHGEGEILS